MQDPGALGAVRGLYPDQHSAVVVKWYWDCPTPATAAPKPEPVSPASSGTNHFFFLCPFFKTAPAHLETANEQRDFGSLLGPTTSWMAALEHQRDSDMVKCVSEH